VRGPLQGAAAAVAAPNEKRPVRGVFVCYLAEPEDAQYLYLMRPRGLCLSLYHTLTTRKRMQAGRGMDR